MMSAIGKRGFTLMELLISGALIAMLFHVSWPRLRGYVRDILIRAESDEWQSRLRHARLRAMLDNETVTVDVMPRKSSFVASVPSVRFYPDGTCDSVVLIATAPEGRGASIHLDASGRLWTDHGRV